MKIVFYLTCFMLSFLTQAQGEYPQILVLDPQETSSDAPSEIYLMTNSEKGLIISDYGNQDCEFEIVTSHDKSIIVTYTEPSQLTGKGRCASGTERGFFLFQFDKNDELLSTKKYLIESCLLSLEVQNENKLQSNQLEYIYENLQTLESYKLQIDIAQATISKIKLN